MLHQVLPIFQHNEKDQAFAHYHNEKQQKLVEEYFLNAAIPTLNNFGSKNIGVFTEIKPTSEMRLYVVIPFKSMEDFVNIQEKLATDPTYNAAGTAYIMPQRPNLHTSSSKVLYSERLVICLR